MGWAGRTAEMALAGDTDALVRDASRPLAQPASVAPPSIRRRAHKDGLLANPIREGAARPLRRCKKEGNGRRRRVGIEGRSERLSHHGIMREVSLFEHSHSGAHAGIRDGTRPAYAFSGQKPANTRHSRARPCSFAFTFTAGTSPVPIRFSHGSRAIGPIPPALW